MYHGFGQLSIKNYYTYVGNFRFNKKMDMEKSTLYQDSSMKEILRTMHLREVENIRHLNFNISDNLRTEKYMVMENAITKMALFMKEIMKMDQNRAMDSILIKMEKYTKEYGRAENLLQSHLHLAKDNPLHNRQLPPDIIRYLLINCFILEIY